MGKRFAIVIGVAAAGVMALGAQTATAAPHVVKYETSLASGHKENRYYHGDVRSKARKCEPGRRVVLFKQRPGADRKVDHDRSDRKGWWEFVPRGRGDFYAKATRERHKGFVCLAARAPTVNFESRGWPHREARSEATTPGGPK